MLDTGVPALIALIGQTRMEKPSEVIPKAIQSIKTQVQDKQKQTHLYTILSSLQRNEEVMKMVEQYLDEMEVDLFDTPFLHRVREEGRTEARKEIDQAHKEVDQAHKEVDQARKDAEDAYEKALSEEKQIWETNGEERSLRNALLDVIALRFNTPINNYRQLETYLNQINDAKLLRSLHQKAILAEDFVAFMQNLQSNPTTNKVMQPA